MGDCGAKKKILKRSEVFTNWPHEEDPSNVNLFLSSLFCGRSLYKDPKVKLSYYEQFGKL